jgi:hypothetical protein
MITSSCLTKTPYDNIIVQNMDGISLFTCDSRRANWYLNRNLAKIISTDPLTIQLNFKTNGLGHCGDSYFLQKFKNVCVVCGTSEELTKHHVFPQLFNRFIPKEYENFMRSNSYNVKIVCVDCHTEYEKVASDFKCQILEKAGLGLRRNIPEHFEKAKRAAWALLNFSNAIPKKDYKKILQKIEKFLNKKYPNYDLKDEEMIDDLFHVVSLEHHSEPMQECFRKYFEKEITSIDKLNDFVILWREHFVRTMNPEYLPENWEIHRRFDIEGR